MTNRRKREHLKIQILETERMLDMVKNHPFMSLSYRKRLETLKEELEAIPLDGIEPKVTLLFSGKPVNGSHGIDAEFIGQVILPFQKMIKAEMALRGFGRVGARGQVKSKEDAKLFLTALPRGSFGVELSKLVNNNLFDENMVAESIAHVARLVESSAKSDEDFAASLENVSQRVFTGLRQMLRAISNGEAGFSIESGGIRATLEKDEVQAAFNRVEGAKSNRKEVEIPGTLKGILLESWKFDFADNDGKNISGNLGQDLSEEIATEYIKTYFNQPCSGIFHQITVELKSGKIKDSYQLIGIKPI